MRGRGKLQSTPLIFDPKSLLWFRRLQFLSTLLFLNKSALERKRIKKPNRRISAKGCITHHNWITDKKSGPTPCSCLARYPEQPKLRMMGLVEQC